MYCLSLDNAAWTVLGCPRILVYGTLIVLDLLDREFCSPELDRVAPKL